MRKYNYYSRGLENIFLKHKRIWNKKIGKYLISKSTCDSFCYKGEQLKLYQNRFNCGKINERMTERGLELAIAKKWLSENKDDLIEIGAVTPYYFPGIINEVVDPADKHKRVTIHKSLFEVDLKDKKVLSISTVEHVGMNEYGISEGKNSIQAIKYIFQNASHCLITYPYGHNKLLDSWTRKHLDSKYLTVYSRNSYENVWVVKTKRNDLKKYGPLWANTVAIIQK